MEPDFLSLVTLACCLAFFFAGVVDSITGGGGLITIPCMLACGIPVHYIVGTNHCATWVGTLVAGLKYLRSGKIHLRSAFVCIPFSMLGSFGGAWLNLRVPEDFLKIFMLVSVPVLALFLLGHRNLGVEDHSAEISPAAMGIGSALIGLVLGAYQGFYGPGAGTFFMLAYALFLKFDLVRGTGNTRLVIALSSVTSVGTYLTADAVLLNLTLAATIFNILGSYLGAALAIKKGVRIIRPLMFFVVTLLIIKLLADLIWPH